VFAEAKLNEIGATLKHSPQNPLDILQRRLANFNFQVVLVTLFPRKNFSSCTRNSYGGARGVCIRTEHIENVSFNLSKFYL
jgi:hypothetical protein